MPMNLTSDENLMRYLCRNSILMDYEIAFTLNYGDHMTSLGAVDCRLQRGVIAYAVLRIHDEFHYERTRFRHTDKLFCLLNLFLHRH